MVNYGKTSLMGCDQSWAVAAAAVVVGRRAVEWRCGAWESMTVRRGGCWSVVDRATPGLADAAAEVNCRICSTWAYAETG